MELKGTLRSLVEWTFGEERLMTGSLIREALRDVPGILGVAIVDVRRKETVNFGLIEGLLYPAMMELLQDMLPQRTAPLFQPQLIQAPARIEAVDDETSQLQLGDFEEVFASSKEHMVYMSRLENDRDWVIVLLGQKATSMGQFIFACKALCDNFAAEQEQDQGKLHAARPALRAV